ncbi:TraB/GumN family protein [Dissulfurirhabdus thermomarina]|uniref:TraB/GumN family protein n=2 Tax=Dissulfurirhabdus thermomarina TaxID=1765737 RepID=A0A6N9TPH8_DISTH|nr:TraB/GumN family protein [Dissulfurirhabdus thermomarina]NDY41644.1 TraB/GumN family protein [Dissulfurirhabdus thermomarina]NMX24336.1 TraB/GumN family protein [Dissulfurirhabdus thermomarina]
MDRPEPNPAPPAGQDPADVHRVRLGRREIVLIGTAHVSRSSVDLVRRTLEAERPDAVCVELDPRRYRAMSQREWWTALDLKAVIRQRQLATLVANLALAAYQRRIGHRLGVPPGTEFLEAARWAEAAGAEVVLADRDVRITLKRAWRRTPVLRRLTLAASLAAGLFERVDLTPERVEELKRSDVLNGLIRELGETLPSLKEVLIDERDAYIAERIRRAPGGRVAAVVGAGHVAGIRRRLIEGRGADLAALEEVPPPSPAARAAAWGVPGLILALLAAVAVRKGAAAAGDDLVYWVLANGIPSAAGALLALAHPATLAAAFLAAPVTSLTPVIGAGYVTALVQAYVRPPLVADFERAGADITRPTAWWRNRLLRVFLSFVLPSIGSLVGTWLGGYRLVHTLFLRP